jgi:hypothetical protein
MTSDEQDETLRDIALSLKDVLAVVEAIRHRLSVSRGKGKTVRRSTVQAAVADLACSAVLFQEATRLPGELSDDARTKLSEEILRCADIKPGQPNPLDADIPLRMSGRLKSFKNRNRLTVDLAKCAGPEARLTIDRTPLGSLTVPNRVLGHLTISTPNKGKPRRGRR